MPHDEAPVSSSKGSEPQAAPISALEASSESETASSAPIPADTSAAGADAGSAAEPSAGAAVGSAPASDSAVPDTAGTPTGPVESAAATPPSTAAALVRPSYVFLTVVTLVGLVADLWSKHWAKSHFESIRPGGDKRLVVIEDAVNFIFAKNRGGAWGLLQNENEALRRPFFLIVSVAAIVFIVSLYRKLQPGQNALKWGLPLVLGGALGNLVDRIRYGYVVDFIDVFMKMDGEMKHWPTFNVADIAICVGVGLMAVDMFTTRNENKKGAVSAESVTLASRVDEPAPDPAAGDTEPKPADDGEDGGSSSPKTAEGT